MTSFEDFYPQLEETIAVIADDYAPQAVGMADADDFSQELIAQLLARQEVVSAFLADGALAQVREWLWDVADDYLTEMKGHGLTGEAYKGRKSVNGPIARAYQERQYG